MRRHRRRHGLPPRAGTRRARAFTLLEILVVIVIIAVMTTIGVLSMGTLGQDRELDSEVERYTDVVSAALEQAVLEGRDFGVHFTPGAYEIQTYAADRNVWEPVPDDRTFEAHPFPPGLGISLELEGRLVQLGVEKPGVPKSPQVVLYSSGDVSPYVLKLAREDSTHEVTITGAPDGTLELERPEESQ